MEKQDNHHRQKKKIDLDWGRVIPNENGPPAELVVVRSDEAKQREMEHISGLSEDELNEKASRFRNTLKLVAHKLDDKGEKLSRTLTLYEEELHRRAQLKRENSKQDQSICPPGACNNGFSSEASSSQTHSESTFTSKFCQNLENTPDLKTRLSVNVSSKKLFISRGNSQQDSRSNALSMNKIRREIKVSTRQSPFQSPKISHQNGNDHKSSISGQNSIAASSFYHPHQDEKSSVFSSKRKKVPHFESPKQSRRKKRANVANATKQRETLVLLDEEDCQPMDTTNQEDEPIKRMEAKIYYPSSDDPECVELDYSDIKCLAPEAFLSSPIMNFYIRYLQRPVSATGRSRSDYHFFNTYFYGKIKEAVKCKRDKDKIFFKFRRWWKGVNIFEKSYILLPIHENYHWSLVIICLPHKEDKSRPIILHLDSLGYHASKQIFDNVRSFLTEEWSYLKQLPDPPDLPIAHEVWKSLPRRIDEEKITVPQQKNDYDCGIFVLYFMERFIEEAPERLRKDGLSMFGRQWFKPEDASRLRGRIRSLLEEEFEKPVQLESESKEPSDASSDEDSDDAAGCTTDNLTDN